MDAPYAVHKLCRCVACAQGHQSHHSHPPRTPLQVEAQGVECKTPPGLTSAHPGRVRQVSQQSCRQWVLQGLRGLRGASASCVRVHRVGCATMLGLCARVWVMGSRGSGNGLVVNTGHACQRASCQVHVWAVGLRLVVSAAAAAAAAAALTAAKPDSEGSPATSWYTLA